MPAKKTYLITEDQKKALLENVRIGLPQKMAIENVGLSETTYYNYQKEAKRIGKILHDVDSEEKITESELELFQFVESIKRAKTEAVKRNIIIIQQASKKNWTASAWWLERRYPQYFGRFETLKVKGGVEVLNFDVKLSDKDMAEFKNRFDDFFKTPDYASEEFDN